MWPLQTPDLPSMCSSFSCHRPAITKIVPQPFSLILYTKSYADWSMKSILVCVRTQVLVIYMSIHKGGCWYTCVHLNMEMRSQPQVSFSHLLHHFKRLFICYVLCVCAQSTCEVSRQFMGVSSLFPSCGSQQSKLGCKPWQPFTIVFFWNSSARWVSGCCLSLPPFAWVTNMHL